MKRWWSWPAVCVVLATGCAVVAEWSSGDDPVQFENPPVWTHKDLGMEAIIGAAIRGDSVIVAGEREAAQRLVVADAKTGSARWSIAEGQVLAGGEDLVATDSVTSLPLSGALSDPVIVDDGGDWSVIVGYESQDEGDEDENSASGRGVAALSGDDGSVEWARPLESGDDSAGDHAIVPVAADQNTVVAMAEKEPHVYTLDATTGEKRWDREKVWPYSVASGVVIGQKANSDGDAPWNEEEDSGGSAYGWDSESGKKTWRAKDTGESFSLRLATGSAVVVSDLDGGQVLDTRTGAKLGETSDWAHDCAADSASDKRFACSLGTESTIANVTVENGGATVTENRVTDDMEWFSVVGMYDGQVFADTYERNETHDGSYILNADAQIIAKDVPGRLADMSNEYAVFLSGECDFGGCTRAGLYKVAKS